MGLIPSGAHDLSNKHEQQRGDNAAEQPAQNAPSGSAPRLARRWLGERGERWVRHKNDYTCTTEPTIAAIRSFVTGWMTPRSVIIPVISVAGVTSKAGL